MLKIKNRIKFILLKLFSIALIFLLSGTVGFAQLQFQTYTLDNGIKIVLLPVENIQTVCVFTYFKTGVRDDPLELKGASTIFKNIRLNSATRNFNYLEGLLYTKNKGGVVGSKVEYDFSYFYQVVQSENLNIALMLEGERFKSLKLNSRVFRFQKNKHLSRLQSLMKNGYYDSYLWVNSKLFANSIYQYPLMGVFDKIRKIELSDIRSVYQRYSDPSLATIIVTGNFDTVDTKNKIIRYFSDIKPLKNNNLVYAPLKLKSEYVSKKGISKFLTENYVIFGIRTPSVLDYNFQTFLFMKYFLLDERGGDLVNYIKNKSNLDVTIDFRLSDNIEANSLIIGVSSKEKINIIRAKYLILNYFKNLPALMLKKKNMIDNIKDLMEIDYLKQVSSLVSRSELFARTEHFFHSLDIFKNFLKKIQMINVENIIGFCKKHFVKEKMVFLYEYHE